MCILLPVSRRALLRTGGFFVATAGMAGFGLSARAQHHIAKTEAKYQDRSNGIQRCEICLQFQPPDRCQSVQGDIGPNGWCQFLQRRKMLNSGFSARTALGSESSNG
jgi:hypothetical protein